jgi:hypothetical protein
MPLIITVERGNLSERRMINATDPEAIKDWLLAVEGAQNPRIEHVASIFQDQMTQFKGELAIKDYVDDVVCTIDEEEFLAKTDSNPRLTRDAADPPPLKWSDLKYVLWHKGGSEHAKEEAHA